MRKQFIFMIVVVISALIFPSVRAAVGLGTNCGLVSSRPVADPEGDSQTFETNALAVKDTSSATAAKITEIGVWIDNPTEAADITLGIYTHNAGDNNPEALLGSATIPKGTTAGWKYSSVDIEISPNTVYWVAAQCDATATSTETNYGAGASTHVVKYSQTTLTDPWGADDDSWSELGAYYAVWEAAAADTCTPPASGNYAVDCSDNCDWSGADTIPGNITMTGSGANVLSAAWTFTGSGQYINIGPDCEFDIAIGGSW